MAGTKKSKGESKPGIGGRASKGALNTARPRAKTATKRPGKTAAERQRDAISAALLAAKEAAKAAKAAQKAADKAVAAAAKLKGPPRTTTVGPLSPSGAPSWLSARVNLVSVQTLANGTVSFDVTSDIRGTEKIADFIGGGRLLRLTFQVPQDAVIGGKLDPLKLAAITAFLKLIGAESAVIASCQSEGSVSCPKE